MYSFMMTKSTSLSIHMLFLFLKKIRSLFLCLLCFQRFFYVPRVKRIHEFFIVVNKLDSRCFYDFSILLKSIYEYVKFITLWFFFLKHWIKLSHRFEIELETMTTLCKVLSIAFGCSAFGLKRRILFLSQLKNKVQKNGITTTTTGCSI